MASPQSEQETRRPECPGCHTELAANAVLCVTCGYHLKEGRRLETEVAPEAGPEPPDPNPYRSPANDFAGSQLGPVPADGRSMLSRIEALESQVRVLERRINSTKLLSPDFFTRMLAVAGYVLLANLLFGFLLIALRALILLVS